MAILIYCPTCNNAVSENAVSCPHCGEPIAQYIRRMRNTIPTPYVNSSSNMIQTDPANFNSNLSPEEEMELEHLDRLVRGGRKKYIGLLIWGGILLLPAACFTALFVNHYAMEGKYLALVASIVVCLSLPFAMIISGALLTSNSSTEYYKRIRRINELRVKKYYGDYNVESDNYDQDYMGETEFSSEEIGDGEIDYSGDEEFETYYRDEEPEADYSDENSIEQND